MKFHVTSSYRKQLKPQPHCSSGMVGAININPTSANNFAAFQTKAKSDSNSGAQGGLVGVGASASTEPFVPSGVTLFPITATAPAASSSGHEPHPRAAPSHLGTTSTSSVLGAAVGGAAMGL
ncbi:hypothetical protein FB451DRAFT_1191969 [Mycena latifolia]|nr:hypothetical protein FB451DRAFT_1191969 [Mycena latifolia]